MNNYKSKPANVTEWATKKELPFGMTVTVSSAVFTAPDLAGARDRIDHTVIDEDDVFRGNRWSALTVLIISVTSVKVTRHDTLDVSTSPSSATAAPPAPAPTCQTPDPPS